MMRDEGSHPKLPMPFLQCHLPAAAQQNLQLMHIGDIFSDIQNKQAFQPLRVPDMHMTDTAAWKEYYLYNPALNDNICQMIFIRK